MPNSREFSGKFKIAIAVDNVVLFHIRVSTNKAFKFLDLFIFVSGEE